MNRARTAVVECCISGVHRSVEGQFAGELEVLSRSLFRGARTIRYASGSVGGTVHPKDEAIYTEEHWEMRRHDPVRYNRSTSSLNGTSTHTLKLGKRLKSFPLALSSKRLVMEDSWVLPNRLSMVGWDWTFHTQWQ